MQLSEVNAKGMATQLLLLSTGRVSASLDSFSGWLAAGFGAALAFLIANLDVVSQHVPVQQLKYGALLVIFSLCVSVLHKLIAGFVSAGVDAAKYGIGLGEDAGAREIPMDFTVFFSEVSGALVWPLSVFARRAFAKVQQRDFAYIPRIYARATQFQSFLVIVQAILSLWGAFLVVSSLKV